MALHIEELLLLLDSAWELCVDNVLKCPWQTRCFGVPYTPWETRNS